MEINEANSEMQKMRGATLYQRKKKDKDAELKDFIIKSVIGKGSFGKIKFDIRIF